MCTFSCVCMRTCTGESVQSQTSLSWRSTWFIHLTVEVTLRFLLVNHVLNRKLPQQHFCQTTSCAGSHHDLQYVPLKGLKLNLTLSFNATLCFRTFVEWEAGRVSWSWGGSLDERGDHWRAPRCPRVAALRQSRTHRKKDCYPELICYHLSSL